MGVASGAVVVWKVWGMQVKEVAEVAAAWVTGLGVAQEGGPACRGVI